MKYLILGLLLVSYVFSQPCTTRRCDSVVVREILSANGISLSAITWDSWLGTRISPPPSGHYPPERITDLNFRSIGLSTIPASIGRLSALRVLDLSVNYISSLPDEIGELDSLEVLRVVRNQLSQFPDVLTSMMLLHYLNLDSNQLVGLPASLSTKGGATRAGFFPLTELRAKHNLLEQLPEGIVNLFVIQRAGMGDLSENKLCNLSTEEIAWMARWSVTYQPQDCGSNLELEAISLEALTVSPNPFRQGTTIWLPKRLLGASMKVLDPSGRVIETLTESTKFSEIRWNPNLPSGVYLLRISLKNEVFTKRLFFSK